MNLNSMEGKGCLCMAKTGEEAAGGETEAVRLGGILVGKVLDSTALFTCQLY